MYYRKIKREENNYNTVTKHIDKFNIHLLRALNSNIHYAKLLM